MSLYDDDAQQGRRGVLSLAEAVKVVKKKIDESWNIILLNSKAKAW